ncbi:hypothetical protein Agabi119p4_8683 [Agaricus bisporus var. burnettii]|uniref:ZZ-type zinc finger-containing protein 3 n=1 Tax=Agaricus bisporus var. burnettii TaxID=192524 RepID=A0A8H7C504_AGABI|nr:hypothetical protein Agabi119p4_8683 [Agaricus bisporus var. burnettii]
MDPRRTQTLDALEAFIQSQTALLDTTRTDIQRLREAKARAITDPAAFLNNLHAELDDPAFRLSSLPDWQLTIPKGVDWTVFEGLDPAPLQKFTLDAQQALVARNQPHTTQKSPLSDLQKLVKNARRTIIDPVLAAFAQMSDLEDDNSESEIDTEQLRREREREKIRQLKKRKIRTCGLKLPSLRMEGSTAVFIRHDVEDESMDVDISLVDDNQPGKFYPKHRVTREAHKIDIPSSKSQPRKKVRKNDSEKSPPPNLQADLPPSKETRKPKPETYKQAWSVSEQHLLEQLLEQIPEGEKYRWQKISRAMNGRRTPRQVASRVQKYFEKLKKYGIQG